MHPDKWEEASAGKRLHEIKITITKQYLDPNTNELTDHNISYTIPTHSQEILGEILFSDLKHDTEDRVNKIRYKLESRYRRQVQHFNNLHKYS